VNRSRNEFLAGAGFTRDQHGGTSVLEAGNHAEDVLNLRRRPNDAVEFRLGVSALAKKFVFFD
jgi:hypothetical protein